MMNMGPQIGEHMARELGRKLDEKADDVLEDGKGDGCRAAIAYQLAMAYVIVSNIFLIFFGSLFLLGGIGAVVSEFIPSPITPSPIEAILCLIIVGGMGLLFVISGIKGIKKKRV